MRSTLVKMAQEVTRKVFNNGTAIGPYSQAVQVGDTVYLSGSLGIDPSTGELKEGIEEQTHQCLTNMGSVLRTANLGYENVVKTTVLLKDINDFNKVNNVYMQYFVDKYPARAAYQVAALPKNALVEIEAIAIAATIKDE